MTRLTLLLLTTYALAICGCCDSIGCGRPITIDLLLSDPDDYPDGVYRVEIADPGSSDMACREFEIADGQILANGFPDCAEWALDASLQDVDGDPSLRIGTSTYWYPEQVTVSVYVNSALQFVGETDLFYESYYADESKCTKCKRTSAELAVEL
jgi:hypothetical protein